MSPDFDFFEPFLSEIEAQQLFDELDDIPWRTDTIQIFGKSHPIPRLQQWFGDRSYTWSGIKMDPIPWESLLLQIKKKIEKKAQLEEGYFNSCLVNLYRDGQDCVGWHADDEPEFGRNPTIASLSLGAARDFLFRRKDDHSAKVKLRLTNGSLLVMRGDCQEEWHHSLPRRKGVSRARINCTFRRVL